MIDRASAVIKASLDSRQSASSLNGLLTNRGLHLYVFIIWIRQWLLQLYCIDWDQLVARGTGRGHSN